MFAMTFPSAPPNVTRSIDAVAQLMQTELPGWWWTCGYCSLSNDASLYVQGSAKFPYARATMGPDFRSGPEALRLLNDPEFGELLTPASIATGAAARCRLQCLLCSLPPRLPWPKSSRRPLLGVRPLKLPH